MKKILFICIIVIVLLSIYVIVCCFLHKVHFSNSWSKQMNKSEILESLKNEISEEDFNFLKSNMPEHPFYILGNNRGKFQEYLQITGDSYYNLSSNAISKPSEKTDVKFSKKGKSLFLNDKKLSGLSENIITSINVDNSVKLSLCCRACYYVHGQLDIHILDCICCFLGNGCSFSCGERASVSISYNM